MWSSVGLRACGGCLFYCLLLCVVAMLDPPRRNMSKWETAPWNSSSTCRLLLLFCLKEEIIQPLLWKLCNAFWKSLRRQHYCCLCICICIGNTNRRGESQATIVVSYFFKNGATAWWQLILNSLHMERTDTSPHQDMPLSPPPLHPCGMDCVSFYLSPSSSC